MQRRERDQMLLQSAATIFRPNTLSYSTLPQYSLLLNTIDTSTNQSMRSHINKSIACITFPSWNQTHDSQSIKMQQRDSCPSRIINPCVIINHQKILHKVCQKSPVISPKNGQTLPRAHLTTRPKGTLSGLLLKTNLFRFALKSVQVQLLLVSAFPKPYIWGVAIVMKTKLTASV